MLYFKVILNLTIKNKKGVVAMKKVLNLLVVCSMVLSTFCFTSYGMGASVEDSLFLKDADWLKGKIEVQLQGKVYKDRICGKWQKREADLDHIYVISENLGETFPGSVVELIVPLKPQGGKSYKEDQTGGSIYFTALFQKKQGDTLKEEDFKELILSNTRAITGGLAKNDELLEKALAEHEEYNWINDSGVERRYISIPFSLESGYLITDKLHAEHQIFWVVVGDANYDLTSGTFVSVEEIEGCFKLAEEHSSGFAC